MQLGTFTEEDAKNAMELFRLISTKAEFTFNTAEALKYAKLISWYNSLPKRLQESAIEVKQVVSTEEKPAKKTRTKK